ncbi:hypothetical protein [Nocardia sp. NBC_01388]|uniref:hypothetical protein n=1 Tax=Nocardia sp. NBC_01388 TaxID=2903596 RepID=UPI00324D015C
MPEQFLIPDDRLSRWVSYVDLPVGDELLRAFDAMAAELLAARWRIHVVEATCAQWADAFDRSKVSHRSRVSQLMGRIAELEQRVSLAVAICDVEQMHRHDPGAPVPAIWTAYALRPDLYERPSDWDAVISEVRKWHPTIQDVTDHA